MPQDDIAHPGRTGLVVRNIEGAAEPVLSGESAFLLQGMPKQHLGPRPLNPGDSLRLTVRDFFLKLVESLPHGRILLQQPMRGADEFVQVRRAIGCRETDQQPKPGSTEEERASGCGWVLRCSWDNGF